MNEKFPQNEREKLEEKLTALLLGELPAHEEAALHRAMDEDPELAGLYERLKLAIELVRSAECGVRLAAPKSDEGGSAELKLSAEKREKLLAHFKTVQPKEFVEETSKRVLFDNRQRIRVFEWAAVAAVALFIAAIAVPNFVRSRSTAVKNTIFNNLRLFDGAKQTLALESNLSANRVVKLDEVRPYLGRGGGVVTDDFSVAGETYVMGKVGEQPAVEMSVSKARKMFGKEVVARGEVHDGKVRLSMDNLLNEPGQIDVADQKAMAALPRELRQLAPKKGDVLGQDASVWKTIRAGTVVAKGGEERPQSALIPREVDQTATFGFNSQTAPATPKPEIFLPSSNESTLNEQLAMNNADFGKFKLDDGNDRFINGANLSRAEATNWVQSLDLGGGTANTSASESSAASAFSEVTNNVIFADSFSPQTNYQMLSQLDAGTGHGNLAINYTNLATGFESKSKTPILGDIPTMGAAFRGEPGSIETNGQFYTGLSHEDVSGLRYLPTNGVVASQAIAGNGGTTMNWNTFDGTTNAATAILGGSVPNEVDLGLAGTNSFADRMEVNGATLADNSQTAKDTERTRGTYYLNGHALPGADEPQTTPPAPQPTPKTEIALPPEPLSGVPGGGEVSSFGGAGSAGQLPNRAVGGKQVEMAAANPQGTFLKNGTQWQTTYNPAGDVGNANVTVDPDTHNLIIVADGGATNGGIVLPDLSAGGAGLAAQLPRPAAGGKQVEMAAAANRARRAPVSDYSYLGNIIRTNATIAGGTTPTPSFQSFGINAEGKFPGGVSGETLEMASVEEAVRRVDKPQNATAQSVQDGKLLIELGKLDEADAKLKEALARDPNNQAAIYYESLIKQISTNGVVAMGGSQPAPTSTNVFAANVVGYTTSDEAEKRTEAHKKEAELAESSAPYYEAKEKLEVEKHWRDVLKMKTGQEGVDKELPAKSLQEQLDEQDKKVELAQAKVDELRKQLNISDENAEGTRPKMTARTLHDLFAQRIQCQADYDQQSTLLAKLKSLAPEDVRKALPIAVTDSQLNALLIELDSAEQSMLRLKGDYSENHQKYQSAKASVDELTRKVDERIDGILAGWQAKVDSERAQLDALNAQWAEVTNANPQATAQALQIQPMQPLTVGKNTQIRDAALPKPAVPPPTPQPEILTSSNAFSTFSMNVSDVSFKLAATSLEKGQMPEPASIRSEEFINAFDYRDPEAAPGVPVAFNYERALYPFAHNRELLRFSLKTAAAGRQAGRPLNIVVLLDNSGSMERADRVGIIQQALRVLAGQLQAQDTFSIVTFARTARLRVDGIPGNQAAAAAEEVSKFTPEGGTDLGNALDVAYETALHHYLPNGDNRVVLLTDGAANLGDVDSNSLKQKVDANRKQGIALDCFGIGWEGYNDDLLEVLTRDGDGRYGFINTPEEASTDFVSQIAGALHVAAADVKVQVEFNPDRVISYRQIGYAKHQLTKEQFRDNTVAAGQIAAQEAGNALYTIEINSQGQGSIGTVRVRYKVPDTGEVREQSWDVPYTGGAMPLEQASPAMRLATTASAFSEWLATSPFAEEVTTDQLLNYLNGVPQVYGADTRPQKLEWMIRQARSISGK